MRLIELREERKLTQSDIANAIKTSRTNIGRWEKGLNEPSSSQIVKLADFFQVSADYLLEREDDFGNVTIKSERSNELPPDSKELLNIFNALDPLHRVQVLEYARYFAMRSGVKIPKKNA